MDQQGKKQPARWKPVPVAEHRQEDFGEKGPEISTEPVKKKRRMGVLLNRKLLLSALILILGAAVYFNWKFVSEPVQTPEESSVRYFGEAELAGTEVSVAQEDAVLTAARTQRRQQMDSAREELNRQARDEKLPSEVRKAAGEQLGDLTRQAAACAQMETRILAKGVADCMVYYDGKSAHVLVQCGKKELDSETVTAVRDVVLSVTSLPASSVTVAEVQTKEPSSEHPPA